MRAISRSSSAKQPCRGGEEVVQQQHLQAPHSNTPFWPVDALRALLPLAPPSVHNSYLLI